jgi:hypothetical protein
MAVGLASAEKEYLAHQIAALRISLARRDADVARLEGEQGKNGRMIGRSAFFAMCGTSCSGGRVEVSHVEDEHLLHTQHLNSTAPTVCDVAFNKTQWALPSNIC